MIIDNFILILIFEVIYFQLSDDSSVQNQTYVFTGVQYSLDEIFVGKLLFYKGISLNQKAASTPYTYIETNNLTVNQCDFGLANLLLKIPPSSQYSYNIKASKLKNIIFKFKSFKE